MWPSSSWVQPACCENHNLFLRYEKEKRLRAVYLSLPTTLIPEHLTRLSWVLSLLDWVSSALSWVSLYRIHLCLMTMNKVEVLIISEVEANVFCWGHLCQFLVESHLTLIGVWGLNLGSRLFEVRMINNSWPMFCSDGFMVTAKIIYVGCNV